MNIHFYLNDEDETMITSFHDLQSNPFKVGDEIFLSVDELYPVEYNMYEGEIRLQKLAANDALVENFHMSKVLLTRETKSMRFNLFNSPILTIEYHCTVLEK